MSIIRMIWNEIIRIKGMIWSDIIRNKADYFGISLTIISLISYMLIIFFKLSTNYIPYNLFLLFTSLSFIFHRIIIIINSNIYLPMRYRCTFVLISQILFIILFLIADKSIDIQNIFIHVSNLNFKNIDLLQKLSFAAEVMSFNKKIPLNSIKLDSYYFILIFILTLNLAMTWLFFSISTTTGIFSKSFRIFLAVSFNMSIHLIPFICNYVIYKELQLFFAFPIIIISMAYFIINAIKLMTQNKDKNIFWYSSSVIIIIIVISIIFGFFYYERGFVLQEQEYSLMKTPDWSDVCRYHIPFDLGMAVIQEQKNFKKEESGKRTIIFSELNEFLNDLKRVYTDKSKINKSIAIFIVGRADEKHIKLFGGKYNSNYELGKARAEGVKKIILDRNIINPNDVSVISASSESFGKNSPAQREVIVVVKIKSNEIDPQNKYFGSLHQAFIYSIYAITGNSYDKLQHRDDLVIVIFSIIEFLFGIIIVTCIAGSIISTPNP